MVETMIISDTRHTPSLLNPGDSREKPIQIRSQARDVEVGWFSALCSDDYEFLGIPDGALRSNFAHCSDIVKTADHLGFQNILLPSSYEVGQEPLVFAGAMAVLTRQIQQLVALRMGEIHPPMLARHISTLDHLTEGRLALNIISSDLPGESLPSADRYARSDEVIQILKQAWTQDRVDFQGRFYKIKLARTDPVTPYQTSGPMLYFGGISPDARELCARHCDVFLMWPETESQLEATMRDMSLRAARYGRLLDFGLRIHVIVRDTERQARDFARRLLSRLDERAGVAIKERSQDWQSEGVRRQDALRALAKDDYIEDHLWSGIGRARSGCASALVGDPDQIVAKLNRYIDMGIRAFIFSGYPHRDECELFARYVLPRLNTCRLPVIHGHRGIKPPITPLTTAPRR